MRIDSLNHASLLITVDGVALLSDPWLEGTAFSGGWGLRYAHEEAFERAAEATHLWISHWHSDHLHGSSLARIARANPDLVVLANVSANFSMVERLRGAGFRDVRPLPERERITLAPGVTVERFPTAGIDNALLLRTPSCAVLNYNDCNLPAGALRRLRRHFGPVDVLLNNYNHAGKLFRRLPPDVQKDELIRTFSGVADILQPRLIVPFASAHLYRCAPSVDQNDSLLDFDELERRLAGDARMLVLRVGDHAQIDTTRWTFQRTRREPAAPSQPAEVLRYDQPVLWDELVETAGEHCAHLARRFPLLSRRVPPLRAAVTDLGRVLQLDARRGASEAQGGAHIEACAQPLSDWLGRKFGADTFVAGAHFGLVDPDTRAIEQWALLTLLEASHLSERDAWAYLRGADGRRFLWNRREEIAATVLGRRFRAGQVRL